jgi:hypothetical protein
MVTLCLVTEVVSFNIEGGLLFASSELLAFSFSCMPTPRAQKFKDTETMKMSTIFRIEFLIFVLPSAVNELYSITMLKILLDESDEDLNVE